jgi:hypothetical protein
VGDDGGLVGVALAVQQVDAVEADLGVAAGMVDPGLDPLATRAGESGRSGRRSRRGEVDLGLADDEMASASSSTRTMRSSRAPLAHGDVQGDVWRRSRRRGLVAFQQEPAAARLDDQSVAGPRARPSPRETSAGQGHDGLLARPHRRYAPVIVGGR